jgi:predicted DsbA family dithiol-disulfide isomerase
VRLAHQFALENDHITGDMVEASEFPHLAQRYQVRAVPRTIINETGVIEGALPEAQFVEAVRAAARKNT